MAKERTIIDQALCNHVMFLITGGAGTALAAEMLGIGKSTVQKIRQAGFDAEKYQQMKQAEKEKTEQKKELVAAIKDPKEWKRWPKPAEQPAEEQVPGQIQMELPEKGKDWQQMLNEIYTKHQNETETARIMRFEAAMTDKAIAEQERIVMVLDKINDTLCMLLRALRKE